MLAKFVLATSRDAQMSIWIQTLALTIFCALGVSSSADFDFFYLTRQWAGGVCKPEDFLSKENSRYCRHVPDDDIFTMHGLWPNRNDGSWPSYCDPHAYFHADRLEDLTDELSEEWPSYYGSDYKFWAHEWLKHGTCSAPYIKGEREYFAKTLELKEKYELMDILKASNITPSFSLEYASWEIEKAIERATGATPIVKCNGGHTKLLDAIWMCFSLDFKPIDCQAKTHEHCHTVKFFPIPHRSYL